MENLTKDVNDRAGAESELNAWLASNYPEGYIPSQMELDSDAWVLREMKRQQMAEWNAEHTRRWLEEEDAIGRIALLCDEANWRVGKSEQMAALAISKAMANE